MSLKNLREAIKEGKLAVGTSETVKALKSGKVKEVFVAKNSSDSLKAELKNLAEISNATYIELDMTNDELGATCKKPFSINCCYY